MAPLLSSAPGYNNYLVPFQARTRQDSGNKDKRSMDLRSGSFILHNSVSLESTSVATDVPVANGAISWTIPEALAGKDLVARVNSGLAYDESDSTFFVAGGGPKSNYDYNHYNHNSTPVEIEIHLMVERPMTTMNQLRFRGPLQAQTR